MKHFNLDQTAASTPDAQQEARLARLTRHLLARLLELEEDGLHLLGSRDFSLPRHGVVAADVSGWDNRAFALLLEERYAIASRCGLYCAPPAHRLPGDTPQEALHFSVGASTTFEDIDYVQGAVYELLRNQ